VLVWNEYLKKTVGIGDLDWIQVAEVRVQCRSVVYIVVNCLIA
jgi:hypothetical protein